MRAFEIFVFLLGPSVVRCANFATVYDWGQSQMDFEWPTQPIRTTALEPKYIRPQFMAAYKERVFLGLADLSGVPVTLASLPTSSVNSAPPKLAPFPDWHFHEKSNCNNFYKARGMQVDSNGHLWVLDADYRSGCKPKLLIFDLDDGDKNILVHHFASPISADLWEIVIDHTTDKKQFAYITEYHAGHITVFNRDEKTSWTVKTAEKRFYSIALSHHEQAGRLYLSEWPSNDIYSVSVADLRSGKRTAEFDFIGTWRASPYRMLIVNCNVLYAAFWGRNYVSTANLSEPFSEQRVYQVGGLGSHWPFSFALDETETFWLTVRNETAADKPSNKLLKAAVGAGPYYLHTASSAAVSPGPSTPSSTTSDPALKCDE